MMNTQMKLALKPTLLAISITGMSLIYSHAFAENGSYSYYTNGNLSDQEVLTKVTIEPPLSISDSTNQQIDPNINNPTYPQINNNQNADLTNNDTPANTLTQTDEMSDLTDDIKDGEAIDTPQPNNQKDDIAIKSIENKNGNSHTTLNLSDYAKSVNQAVWEPNMNINSATTLKLQALLDWNHASPGPIDGGWGMNSKKALTNFQTMKGLPATGRMDESTWKSLNQNIPLNQPVLVQYTITKDDINTKFATTPAGAEEKSKMKGLYYQNIKEMFGERFHMDIRYLEKLNKNKHFKVGETITVFNTGVPLKERITRVIANKADKTLYAYNGNKLIATYPTTVGSSTTPSPHGTYKIVNKVKMPWYKATVGDGDSKKVHMLPPGPNSPVGVVWMGLSKPSYGLHGSPKPEGISRQASHGCIRLTNWDVLEVYDNIQKGAIVELK